VQTIPQSLLAANPIVAIQYKDTRPLNEQIFPSRYSTTLSCRCYVYALLCSYYAETLQLTEATSKAELAKLCFPFETSHSSTRATAGGGSSCSRRSSENQIPQYIACRHLNHYRPLICRSCISAPNHVWMERSFLSLFDPRLVQERVAAPFSWRLEVVQLLLVCKLQASIVQDRIPQKQRLINSSSQRRRGV
jgi:hypothetical protein